MRRQGVVVAVLVAVLAVAGLTAASAASLPATGGTLTTIAAGAPCSGPVAVTTPSTTAAVATVEVTAPAACVGRDVAVAVTAGAVTRQGSATAAAGAFVIALDGTYVPSTSTTVAATVDGWAIAATWTYTPPAAGPTVRCWTTDPARPCSATAVVRDHWATGYNLDITITDTRTVNANNPVPWTIEIDFSGGAYPFVPNALDGSGVVPGANACGTRPVMTFTGVTSWGDHHELRRGTVRTVWLQARNDGNGAVLDCVP